MKKLWLLTVCCSVLIFHESFASQTAETVVLDFSDEEIVIPASKPLAEASQNDIELDSPIIPDMKKPDVALVPTKDVELSTDSPKVKASSVKSSLVTKIPHPSMGQRVKIDPKQEIAAIVQEEKQVLEDIQSKPKSVVIDLGLVFAGSPTIYSILFILSITSVGIWAYAILSLRSAELFPTQHFNDLKEQLQGGNYDAALQTCQNHPSLLFGMVEAALKNRHLGSATMLEMMKTEGKRISTSYWQKIGLLNEIAIIAPMLGLLGTVLGMFYAFYDLNRSAESISALFDGLGISVGTTVGGLIVAILALMFHAMTKYRLMKQLTLVENRAYALVQPLIHSQEKP